MYVAYCMVVTPPFSALRGGGGGTRFSSSSSSASLDEERSFGTNYLGNKQARQASSSTPFFSGKKTEVFIQETETETSSSRDGRTSCLLYTAPDVVVVLLSLRRRSLRPE